MQLTGKQSKQILDTLLDAFSTKDELRRMVEFELEERLDAIAGGENLTAVVYNLITWARQRDRIGELIQGAHNQVSGNPKLQQLLRDYQEWVTAQFSEVDEPKIIAMPTSVKLPFTLQGHTDDVRSVAFSPDGKSVVSAGADKSIKIWDVAAYR